VNRLIFILLLVSCSGVKHYRKVATDTKVTVEKKAIIAPFVSTYFPVRERVKSDTVIKVDTVYDESTSKFFSDIIDSLVKSPAKKDYALIKKYEELKKACAYRPETTIYIRDTIYAIDEAERFAMDQYVKSVEQENAILKKDKNVAEDRMNDAIRAKRSLSIYLWIAGVVIGVLCYLFFRFK
jgi:hypothetical protein